MSASIAVALDRLRAAQAGCALVAFGDLGTRLVLRTSAEKTQPQEFLDRICEQAVQTFALCDSAGSGANHATVVSQKDTRLFVRCKGNGSDFLCCVCDGDDDLEDFAASAKTMLREMSQGQ